MVGTVRALTGKFGGPKFNFCPDSYLTIILFLKSEWAIDLEAMRARGIIVLVKSN